MGDLTVHDLTLSIYVNPGVLYFFINAIVERSPQPSVDETSDVVKAFRRQRAFYTLDSLAPFFESEAESAWPADRIIISKEHTTVFHRTKPTNIGLGALALLAAEQLGRLTPEQTNRRLAKMLDSLNKAERYQGFFYDWYDSSTMQTLTKWPTDEHELDLFLSSVDNAWLALALLIISLAKPIFAELIKKLYLSKMDFEFFIDPDHQDEIRGGYNVTKKAFSPNHYPRSLVSEPRIVHWVNAALNPVKEERIKILRRLLDKDGTVPSKPAGGALFELLMPQLFVRENYLSTVTSQIFAEHQTYGDAHFHGLIGSSVVDNPNTGFYAEMGIGGIYSTPPVLSSHGAALAFLIQPEAAYHSLLEMEKIPGFFGEKGYEEAVDIETGNVTSERVFINQVMVLLSLMGQDTCFAQLFEKCFDGEVELALP